jgi:spore coat-associated protein N
MSILQRNKKKATAIGIAAAAIAAIAIGGGTYAAFSDTETGPTGTLAAGTINLTVGGSITPASLDLSKLKPGDSFDATITVKNDGNLTGTLFGDYSLTGSEGGCTAAEINPANYPNSVAPTCDANGPGNLISALVVTVGGQAVSPLAPGSAAGVQQFDLAPGASQSYAIHVSLPASTGNEVQSDTASLTSKLTLKQKA